jgi:hypothetical protein
MQFMAQALPLASRSQGRDPIHWMATNPYPLDFYGPLMPKIFTREIEKREYR